MAAVANSLATVSPALIAVFPRSLVAALDRCDANVFVVSEVKAPEISLVSASISQKPTYIEVGPLMTTRFGEVRSGTAKG